MHLKFFWTLLKNVKVRAAWGRISWVLTVSFSIILSKNEIEEIIHEKEGAWKWEVSFRNYLNLLCHQKNTKSDIWQIGIMARRKKDEKYRFKVLKEMKFKQIFLRFRVKMSWKLSIAMAWKSNATDCFKYGSCSNKNWQLGLISW